MQGRHIYQALQKVGELSYDQARAMPPGFYTDPCILALEREQLFMREWICLGRQEEVARPGDFLTAQICDEPVVVVHGEDGKIRALSNVCRHRGTVMATGRGNKRRRARSFVFLARCHETQASESVAQLQQRQSSRRLLP